MISKTSPFPPLAISTEPTTINQTGGWRFERPQFWEKIAPCSEACPLGLDMSKIMAHLSLKETTLALQKILWENPFSGMCGLYCPAPCERACNRGRFDEPVSIKSLELFCSQASLDIQSFSKAPAGGFHIGIIGKGIAAWSCAWFLLLLGHQVDLWQEEQQNYKDQGQEPWINETKRIIAAGLNLKNDPLPQARDMDLLLKEYEALFIEPGLWPPANPGEVISSRQFLREVKKDSSLPGKSLLVLGSGAKGREAALRAAQRGLQVRLILEQGQSPLEEIPPGVDIMEDTEVLGLLKSNNQLRGVLCRRQGEEFEEAADQVIMAWGGRLEINFELPERVDEKVISRPALPDSGGTPPDPVQLIALGKGAALSLDLGLRKKSLDRITGAAMGQRGALSLEAYQNRRSFRLWQEVVSFESLNFAGLPKSGRAISTQADTMPTSPQALKEARRCLNCGICTFCGKCDDYCPDLSIHIDPSARTREIDYDHCKGCGICAQECPRGAIAWLPE